MRKSTRLQALLLSFFSAMACWAAVPFSVTTIQDGQFAPGTVWYTMQIGANQFYITDNGDADRITLSGHVTTEFADTDLWCFVGDETNGYQIYNKKAGTGKVLASSATMGSLAGIGGTGGSTYPTLQDVNNLPGGYIGTWDFRPSEKLVDIDGYFVVLHGTECALNNFGNLGDLAFWAEGMDEGSTVNIQFAETTLEIKGETGEFTASNAAGNWHAVWSSNQFEGFTLGTGANNMTLENGYIAGHSGTVFTSTYTLTAPEGCRVAAYSFDFCNRSGSTKTETLTVNGQAYSSSATEQHIAVDGLEERIASFVQTGDNGGIVLKNFFVTIGKAIKAPEPMVEIFPTKTTGDIPYRIPAIAKAFNGDLIAVADYRHSRADIGMAHNGRIDLRARISKDNGKTWGDIFDIICGQGANSPDFMNVGYGDPCIVADCESDRVLVMSCAGNVSFPNGTRNNHQNIARFYSTDNGATWSEPDDIAESIYSQFDNSPIGPVRAMFIGSGKILQSRTVKVKDYYRIYCAVLLKDKNSNHTNFVLYSDDFGGTWNVLGGVDVCPIPSGADEPKVEELPDGSILLSSRIQGGRFYNIFQFTDPVKAEGVWGKHVTSNSSNNGVVAVSNSTNGEVLLIPAVRKEDNRKVFLLLQSVPFGSGRSNVGIYYKELQEYADFDTPANIAKDWDGRHQASYVGSAYSTMILQADNTIGFLYEEDTYGVNGGGGYNIVYKNYTIEQITDDAYAYSAETTPFDILSSSVTPKYETAMGQVGKYVGNISAEGGKAIEEAYNAYQNEPSQEAFKNFNNVVTTAERIALADGTVYRIHSVYAPGQYMTIDETSKKIVVEEFSETSVNQLFTFVAEGEEGKWRIYNDGLKTYVGRISSTKLSTATAVALSGLYTVSSSADGESVLNCTNGTSTSSGVFLNKSNAILGGNLTADGSKWYIEPEGPLTDIEKVEAVQGETPEVYYDLSGRIVKNPGKGIFVTSSKRKVILK